MTDERVAWQTARLSELERIAKDAKRVGLGVDFPFSIDERFVEGYEAADAYRDMFSPTAALARVDADRRILADIASWKHHYDDSDPWHSCALAESIWDTDRGPGSGCSDEFRSGGPCDCGLDRRRDVIVRTLLSAHRYAPDFREEWL